MKRRSEFSSEEISGFLDQGTSITGELRFSGTLRIDGEFHGSITTSDKLIVGEHAQIHADIKGGETEVYGKISGSVDSKKRIQIYATGRIQGEVRTPVLVIEEGGAFDGNSDMAGDDKSEELFESPRKSRKEWPSA